MMAAARRIFALTLAVIPGTFVLAANAVTSVAQVRDTLQNLLRSVEDAGSEAEALYTQRQHWCAAALQSVASNASAAENVLTNLREELVENQAAVKEASGTVQQVQADIKLVEHTIKQTEELLQVRQRAEKKEIDNENKALEALSSKGNAKQMTKRLTQTRKNMRSQFETDVALLTSLIDNKRQGLASLKGQLQVALPSLSQLEAKVAETSQRIDGKSDSVAVSKGFTTALKQSCSAISQRADSQASARVGEASSVEAAIQALERLSSELHEQLAAPTDTQDNTEVSFVQMRTRAAVATEEDLIDLFSGPGDDEVISRLKQDEAFVADGDEQSSQQYKPDVAQIPQYTLPKVTVPPLKSLLAQLRSTMGATTSKHQAWCTEERNKNELALKLSQNIVSQVASEVEAHADAVAELTADLNSINATALTMDAVSKEMRAAAKQEQSFLLSKAKDQELATKILAQASTIMTEVGQSHPDGQGTGKVMSALQAASSAFRTQLQSTGHYSKEVQQATMEIVQNAAAASTVLQHEMQSAKYLRDDHAAQRLKSSETKEESETQLKEAKESLQTLARSCRSGALEGVLAERNAEIQGLEDAESVLKGKSLATKSPAAHKLRGGKLSSKSDKTRILSPMEKAAQEMGVNVDASSD